MKLFAVIGQGVRAKSASPAMHNASFRRLGVDAHYLAIEVPAHSLRCFTDLARLNLAGFNVTIPLKELILEHLDGVNMEARAIGAVNTVKVERNLLVGFNTDFQAIYRLAGKYIEGGRVLILGAGGAARAALYAAIKAGAAEIVVANRTRERALELAREFAEKFGRSIRGQELANLPKADVVVNATPVHDRVLAPLDGARAYVEYVYNPPRTAMVELAESLGVSVVDGVSILVEQGAIAEEIWLGVNPDREIMRRAVLDFLGQGATS
ncbi:shikimate dehydrogenase family protein [Thermoproteus tenax]|uniref:Shikimate dehydrogenase (NADP(+)) n=1 Tax=Thermoproteus tenax (strain ATCC 35583 / DSM 2078 / JCM 9277 / NBRC 100435 / Kra 1) TaxID=768679 RepID=G4RLC4_THETK|nr:shikimate dehydrogenase [Thermoproteus tenax]CCC82369.1 Shikimate 5-dehydrogenase [Thermoproteus tenax Kra 1]